MEFQIQTVQAAINYIEGNLLAEVELEGIAEAAQISLSHLYRIFFSLTGMTIKEYIRYRRMAKAAVELRAGEISIIDAAIKYGFSSQEAFSRVFNKLFNISPGEYRKTGNPIIILEKKDILKDFIHKAAHEALEEGVFKKFDVNIYVIFKPAHKWIAKLNKDNWDNFYEECYKKGIMKLIDKIPSDRRYGGGTITDKTSKHIYVSYGKEVPEDYEGEIPEFCDSFTFPAANYAVFNHPPYSQEDHGSVIKSVYGAIDKFIPEEFGFTWDIENLPIYNDDDLFGFTVARPLKLLSSS